MKDIIVLGIGNILMKDDGIGVYLVKELSKLDNLGRFRFVSGETDIDYCLSTIVTADYLVIIDAFINGKLPGNLTVLTFDRLSSNERISIHNQSLLQHIKQFRKELRGVMIGIEPFEITFQLGLSNTLKDKLPTISSNVIDIINNLENNK